MQLPSTADSSRTFTGMGKHWYLVRRDNSVFVKYVDGTKFINHVTKIPFEAVRSISKLLVFPNNHHALDVSYVE